MAKKNPAVALAAVPSTPAINMELLIAIGAATAVAPHYMNVPLADAQALGDLVQINPDPQFAAGGDVNIPGVRISALGTEHLAKTGNTVTQPATQVAPAVKPKFNVVSFALPEAKRAGGGGARPEVYPFSSLNIGEAFFVPATAEKAEPWKTFASTVASATNRYNEVVAGQTRVNRKGATVPVTKQTKKFEIRGPIDGAPFGYPGVQGAAVGRTK